MTPTGACAAARRSTPAVWAYAALAAVAVGRRDGPAVDVGVAAATDLLTLAGLLVDG